MASCCCRSESCGHELEEGCGEPVKVRFKCSVLLKDGGHGEEFETGLCEKCWAQIQHDLGR